MHNEWEFLSKVQIKMTGDCRNVLIVANVRDYAAFRRIVIGAELKSLQSQGVQILFYNFTMISIYAPVNQSADTFH